MNALVKATCLLASFQAPAAGGRLDIVQLGPPEVTRIGIACGGADQDVDLPHGGTTGGFVLPVEEGIVTTPNLEIPALTLPATDLPNIAVLTTAAEGFRWKLIPGKPAKDKWAMRVINVSSESATLTQDGNPLDIEPGIVIEIPVKGKAGMSVLLEGADKKSYEAEEPGAALAIIYRKNDMWEILFVPDR